MAGSTESTQEATPGTVRGKRSVLRMQAAPELKVIRLTKLIETAKLFEFVVKFPELCRVFSKSFSLFIYLLTRDDGRASASAWEDVPEVRAWDDAPEARPPGRAPMVAVPQRVITRVEEGARTQDTRPGYKPLDYKPLAASLAPRIPPRWSSPATASRCRRGRSRCWNCPRRHVCCRSKRATSG